MGEHKTYLLKTRIPLDPHSGFDFRFMELCPFIDEVFFVKDRLLSTSGEDLEEVQCLWPATKLGAMDDLESHLEGRRNAVWIAADYKAFKTLKQFGVGKVIYDNCDSRSLYYWRRFRVMPMKRWKSKLNSIRQCIRWGLREHRILRDCQVIIVPAEKDRRAFLYWGKGRVEVVTNGTSWVRNPPVSRKSDAQDCMFHGVFSWEVNVTTAEFIVRTLYPELKKTRDQSRVRIAGYPIPESLVAYHDSSGIFMEGFVEDIQDWLSNCGVYVMPMFQGGGVKNKLLESMAAGLPIVTNSMGAEAMPDDSRSCYVVVDGLENTVNAVVELLGDREKAEKLAARARAYAEEHFQWEPLSSKYRKIVSEMAEG